MRYILLVFALYANTLAYTQVTRASVQCYPTNWWAGMKEPKLQLMLHGENIGSSEVHIVYPGIVIKKIHKVENANYLFVDLYINTSAKPGTFKINLNKNKTQNVVVFELKKRRIAENGKTRIRGVSSADLIYFLMPDRFSNGDSSNDSLPGMLETVTGRNKLRGRHGGDFAGVRTHLDYIKELGATAIWMTPVIVNDMDRESYHGYAFTDHYTVDPRFGGEKGYHDLIEEAHKNGLKIIQDAVYNHVGINHITVRDMPMKNWLNEWPSYTNTSYKDQVIMDPYGSNLDRKIMSDGWFTPRMPDLNQRNPFVANYLIQHAIWTTENFGIDGWRIDTYPYCDLDFMNKCNKALLDQYPQIGIFAETWVHGVVNQAYFVNNNLNIPFKSNLPGSVDFQVHFAIENALLPNARSEAVTELYSTLAKDFVYKNPFKNCIFLDNHDMNRFFSTIALDTNKYKIGINWLLTLRGIPALYYGTEILMNGTTNPSDAQVRTDFPGGWVSDSSNKFTAAGRSKNENAAFNYVKTLGQFRKQTTALQTGKLMQYVPYGGLYVYFRYDEAKTIMIISNTSEKQANVKFDRFEERIKGFSKMKNIFTGEVNPLLDFSLPSNGSGIYELVR